MVLCGGHLGFLIGQKNNNFVKDHPRNSSAMKHFHWLLWFLKRRPLKIFPIGSNVKLCSSVTAILDFRSANKNNNFVEDHPRNISAMKHFHWLLWFLRRRPLKIFPIGSNVKLCSSVVAILDFKSAKKTTTL